MPTSGGVSNSNSVNGWGVYMRKAHGNRYAGKMFLRKKCPARVPRCPLGSLVVLEFWRHVPEWADLGLMVGGAGGEVAAGAG